MITSWSIALDMQGGTGLYVSKFGNLRQKVKFPRYVSLLSLVSLHIRKWLLEHPSNPPDKWKSDIWHRVWWIFIIWKWWPHKSPKSDCFINHHKVSRLYFHGCLFAETIQLPCTIRINVHTRLNSIVSVKDFHMFYMFSHADFIQTFLYPNPCHYEQRYRLIFLLLDVPNRTCTTS